MKAVGWITFFYALLVLVGGIIGHLVAQSNASLIAGIIFGVLLIFCAIGMFRDHLFPTYSGIIIILLLTAFFGYRWLHSFRFMPAGLMFLISLVVLISNGILTRNHFKKQQK